MPRQDARFQRRLSGRIRRLASSPLGGSHLGGISADELHVLHRQLRQVRIELRLWNGFTRSTRGREDLDRLRHLTGLVGEVRDRDVSGALVKKSLAEQKRRFAIIGISSIQRRLDAEGEIGRGLLTAYARSLRTSHLFNEVQRRVDRSALPSTDRRFRLVSRSALTKQIRRLIKAARRTHRKPTTSRLHQLRIEIRRGRTLRAALGGSEIERSGRTGILRRLQALLGRIHDQDVLLAWIDRLPPAEATSRWGRAVRLNRKEFRAKVLHEVSRRGFRREVARLARVTLLSNQPPPRS